MIKLLLWSIAVTGALIIGLVATTPDVRILKTQYPVVEPIPSQKSFHIRWTKKRPPNWVRLREISPYAVGAVIVSEDWNFYHHPGFDADELFKMLREFVEDGERLRGASTLTQQVAKNVFLTNERSLLRKAREFFIALALETHLSKQEILEVYFNVVEWGDGIYGIRRAAQFYFEKSPAQLDAKEAAFLSMLLPNPRRYSESFRQKSLTPYARRVTSQILKKMRIGGYVTPEELEVGLNEPLAFEN